VASPEIQVIESSATQLSGFPRREIDTNLFPDFLAAFINRRPTNPVPPNTRIFFECIYWPLLSPTVEYIFDRLAYLIDCLNEFDDLIAAAITVEHSKN